MVAGCRRLSVGLFGRCSAHLLFRCGGSVRERLRQHRTSHIAHRTSTFQPTCCQPLALAVGLCSSFIQLALPRFSHTLPSQRRTFDNRASQPASRRTLRHGLLASHTRHRSHAPLAQLSQHSERSNQSTNTFTYPSHPIPSHRLFVNA